MVYEENKKLGMRLRMLRTELKMSQAEVANQLSCTASFLSLVENGHSGISLSKLQQLLSIYGKNMADIIDKNQNSQKVVSLTNADRLGFYGEQVDAFLMVKNVTEKKMEPVVFCVKPGESVGPMSHKGEEFCYVIEGRFTVSLYDPKKKEKKEYELEAGDGIYYSSEMHHTFYNPTQSVSVFLGIVTPPSF